MDRVGINNEVERLLLDARVQNDKYRISVREDFDGVPGTRVSIYLTTYIDTTKITKITLDIFDLSGDISEIEWDTNSPSFHWSSNEQKIYTFKRKHMDKLKSIIGENTLTEVNWPSLSISDILDKVLKFDDHTLIFFDTETLGLKPQIDYVQLTQLGIIVVDGSTMKEQKSLNIKIEFNESSKRFLQSDSEERKEWEKANKGNAFKKTPNEILDMTGYFNNLSESPATEEQALKIFKHLISNAHNPILIAHNAEFDMGFVNVRAEKYNFRMPKVKVIDTLKLAQFFLIPMLQALNKSEILDKLKKVKEMKISDIKPKDKKKKKKPGATFERFTAEDGTEMLRIIYGYPSASLGKLTPVLIGEIENWHDALADVKSMILIMQQTIEILQANRNVDLTKFIGLMVTHLKNREKWFKSRGIK